MTVHLRDQSSIDWSVAAGSKELEKTAGSSAYRERYKRVFEFSLVLLAFPACAVLIAIMALLAMTDGSNPFFVQHRVGRNGRVYRMVKIRTMVVNAERKLSEYLEANPAALLEWTTTQKLKNDPRVTAVGRLLRKTSLDELPQLWNVLKGDMALVGPRPMMEDQRGLYPGLCYYKMRPGITGPWQISERNMSAFADRAWYDSEYFKNVSFGYDLSILFRTFAVVLRGTGY